VTKRDFVAAPTFQPGFRLSAFDVVVIIAGLMASVALWSTVWWIGFVVAFVVAHFFLFCNVFRVARPLELLWSGIFVTTTYITVAWEIPSWLVTIVFMLIVTATVIAIEMRKPSYHGVFWRRINPDLRKWWATHGGALA
jgi:hypothetical protein